MIDVIPDRIPPGGVEIPLLGQREGRDHTGPSLRQTGAKVYGTERGTHQLGQQGAQFLVITASQIRLRHEADADATVGKIREEAVTILDLERAVLVIFDAARQVEFQGAARRVHDIVATELLGRQQQRQRHSAPSLE